MMIASTTQVYFQDKHPDLYIYDSSIYFGMLTDACLEAETMCC